MLVHTFLRSIALLYYLKKLVDHVAKKILTVKHKYCCRTINGSKGCNEE